MPTLKPQIELADIDSELKRLWDEELGKNKIRACLFNFVIFVNGKENASRYDKIIRAVVSKFPCRVTIILNSNNLQEQYLKTSVKTETVEAGQLQIFCDIIQIEVAGPLLERVPFIVLPHFVPDLPIYLLWTQDPSTESTILPKLEKFAKRIVFDSEGCHCLQTYSRSVLLLKERFHSEIGDLKWSALSGWRKIFASVFDTPDLLEKLNLSKSIRIAYNRPNVSAHNSEVEAAYLHAWLASSLDWKFRSYEKKENTYFLKFLLSSQEKIITISSAEVPSLPAGAIISIEIESLKNGSRFVLKRHPETKQVFIQQSDNESCELPYSVFLEATSPEREITQEIFYPSSDGSFQRTLELLSSIPWEER